VEKATHLQLLAYEQHKPQRSEHNDATTTAKQFEKVQKHTICMGKWKLLA